MRRRKKKADFGRKNAIIRLHKKKNRRLIQSGGVRGVEKICDFSQKGRLGIFAGGREVYMQGMGCSERKRPYVVGERCAVTQWSVSGCAVKDGCEERFLRFT